MQGTSSAQHCLPSLAAVFSFPSPDLEFSARIDSIIASGECAVSVVFKCIREGLAGGEGERSPTEMRILVGLIGTGITLLEAYLVIAEQKNLASLKQAKLRSLLEEYRNLLEDIELFSRDVSTEDCFRAACLLCLEHTLSDMNTPEDDAACHDS